MEKKGWAGFAIPSVPPITKSTTRHHSAFSTYSSNMHEGSDYTKIVFLLVAIALILSPFGLRNQTRERKRRINKKAKRFGYDYIFRDK